MKSLYLITTVLSLTAAHNWLNGPSRSEQESSTYPCGENSDVPSQPQMRVALGQPFDVQPITGHSNTEWILVALRAEDQGVFNGHDAGDVRDWVHDYIKEAEQNGGIDLIKQDPKYRRHHIAMDYNQNKDDMDGRLTERDHPDEYYILPEIYWDKSKLLGKAEDAKITDQEPYRYKDSQLDGDGGSWHYSSSKKDLEFILSASQSYVTVTEAREWDNQKFSIPASAGSGRFIVKYNYKGWHDCVDILVEPTATEIPAAAIYGGTPAEPIIDFEKTVHGQYISPVKVTGCQPMGSDGSIPCLDDCEENEDCEFVNVVPRVSRPNTFEGEQANHQCSSLGTSEYVCYGGKNGVPKSSLDPESNIFYSAYYKKVELNFPASQVPQLPVPYRYGNYCLSCEDRDKFSAEKVDPRRFSFLTVGQQCIHCDL